MRHPDDEQLLRYSDGELPARAAAKVRSHLEACWQCRVELEELQNTVSECVRYRKNTLERHLPPPPAPWPDIYRRFADIDTTLEPAFFNRVARILQWPIGNAKRWAPVAVALMVVFGLLYRFRQTPSVQAAELLRKAIVAADARPEKARKLQIRTREHHFTRLTGPERKLASGTADSDTLNSIQTLFRAANYDWEDPLNAKSYQAWRERLPEKQDQVIEERDSYSIRTGTGSGELMQATLKLRTQDLRPVEGRFEFRNQEWVEITELAEDATPSLNAAAASDGSHTTAPAPPQTALSESPNGAVQSNSTATAGDELHVLASLHQVGADLGDPIEVSRAGGDILVTGVGIAPERRQEINEALGGKPHVIVRFSESVPARIQPQREALSDSAASPNVRQLQARMAEQVGGRVLFEQLSAQVLDLSEPMMSRAYALRRLAEQFPVEAESELSAPDRQLLVRLRQEHTSALRQQTAEMELVLKPVLVSMSGAGSGTPGGVTSSGAWQPATEELFQSARHVEKLLAVMFGAAPGESSVEQLPAQLLSSLAQLRARLETYDRFSAQAVDRRNK